jgi:hypothetical protein
MRDLVVLEDSTILSLLADPAYAETIPCFINKKDLFKTGNVGCGACAKKRQDKQRAAMAQIKSCLAGMSDQKKKELKTLLNTAKVRVVYASNSGSVVQLTF